MNKNFLKQAQQLQVRLNQVQKELETETVQATSGGGVISVTCTGKQIITSINVDPSAVDPTDVEMLQDLILAAVNEALIKSQELAAARIGEITGGMNLPGM